MSLLFNMTIGEGNESMERERMKLWKEDLQGKVEEEGLEEPVKR